MPSIPVAYRSRAFLNGAPACKTCLQYVEGHDCGTAYCPGQPPRPPFDLTGADQHRRTVTLYNYGPDGPMPWAGGQGARGVAQVVREEAARHAAELGASVDDFVWGAGGPGAGR